MAFITPPTGVDWGWSTFKEYLQKVSDSSPATNLVPLVGHGTVRIAVMGVQQRAPTQNELSEMEMLVDEAMEAGAYGISTGLVYVPGNYAETEEIVALENKYVLQTYGRPEFVLERGNGVYLFDTDGNRYLDFVSGLSVNALGYGDYEVLKAIETQMSKLMHVSNLYHTMPSTELAQKLVESSFADRAFFCNSGTESWEAAMKFARKWAYKNFSDNPKYKFVAMNQSFHGRTYGSISSTGQPKYHKGCLLYTSDAADE